MSNAVAVRDRYLETLLNQATLAAQNSSLALDTLRAAARAVVQERTFPSNRDENWRFTDLSSLLATDFQTPVGLDKSVLAQAKEQLHNISLDTGGKQVVFVNGTFVDSLSRLGEGVNVLSQIAVPD